MHLKVLGGSSASPNPGMGCSGYLVDAGSTRIVLDFGPGILPELRRHTDFRRLDGVVISHMHLDHMLDLLILRHALAYNPLSAPAPVPIWLPPGGHTLLDRATAPFDRCDEPGVFDHMVVVRDYDPSAPLLIGELSITFAPTIHFVPGYAMRVTDRDKRTIGYTGDTGPTAPLVEFFRGVDLLVAEATLLDPGAQPIASRGSLTAAEAGHLAQAAGTSILLLAHMWEEFGFANYANQAAEMFPGRIELARPGLAVTV